MTKLDMAIGMAVKAHAGQLDKAGQPYILHPLRVMFSLGTETQMVVGVLHDIIEDTYITKKDLRIYFNEDIVNAIYTLTRRQGETYTEMIVRIQNNKLASMVKLADLQDNLDLMRLNEVTSKDFERWMKYRRAWETIKETL